MIPGNLHLIMERIGGYKFFLRFEQMVNNR